MQQRTEAGEWQYLKTEKTPVVGKEEMESSDFPFLELSNEGKRKG